MTVSIAHAAEVGSGRGQYWNPGVGIADARVSEGGDAIRWRWVTDKSADSERLSLVTHRRHVVERQTANKRSSKTLQNTTYRTEYSLVYPSSKFVKSIQQTYVDLMTSFLRIVQLYH